MNCDKFQELDDLQKSTALLKAVCDSAVQILETKGMFQALLPIEYGTHMEDFDDHLKSLRSQAVFEQLSVVQILETY